MTTFIGPTRPKDPIRLRQGVCKVRGRYKHYMTTVIDHMKPKDPSNSWLQYCMVHMYTNGSHARFPGPSSSSGAHVHQKVAHILS